MMEKFLFFDIKRNLILNIIITLQIILSIFYSASLISIVNFEGNYEKNFYGSMPIENTQEITFYEMMMKLDGKVDKDAILETLSLLEKNNYPYGIFKSSPSCNINKNGVSISSLVKDTKLIKKPYEEDKTFFMNEGMINEYKNKIDGNFELDSWDYNDTNIPIILGDKYRNKLKLNEIIKSGSKNYKVVGFMDKNTMAFNARNSITGSMYLDSMVIMPITKDMFLDGFNYLPILMYTANVPKNKTEYIKNEIKKIRSDVKFESMTKDVNEFIEALNSQIAYDLISTITIVTLSIASLLSVILYKLLKDRDRIGILYSFGVSKWKIGLKFIKELIIYVAIGMIIGSVFYFRKGSLVFSFFINTQIYLNILISILAILILITALVSITINRIGKMTPKELIGGFIE